jgi:hypothetical protein
LFEPKYVAFKTAKTYKRTLVAIDGHHHYTLCYHHGMSIKFFVCLFVCLFAETVMWSYFPSVLQLLEHHAVWLTSVCVVKQF